MTVTAAEEGPPVMQPSTITAEPPLCVDLDGTLVATDTLHEMLLVLLRHRPLALLAAVAELRRGRAAFKRRVASLALLDPATLPYHPELLAFLREQRAAGRRLVLATASDGACAEAVARHLQLFEQVVASDGARNMKGAGKLTALRELLGAEFDYVGDAPADVPLWQAARKAYVVGSRRGLAARLARPPERVFARERGGLAALLSALRPQQWAKNLLLFVPLFTAHLVGEGRLLLDAVLAFVAFCCAASAGYVFNDLLDLQADREHPRKRFRPFARGTLGVAHGVGLVALLLAAAAALAWMLPPRFGLLLTGYLAATIGYSLYFKRKLLLDVILLAGLYTLRVLAGGAAVDVHVSRWLLAFSMFLFLSLAFAKRYSELQLVLSSAAGSARGRGYRTDDMDIVLSSGSASGLVAVLVFSLYINSPEVAALYEHSEPLWLVCPILLYWILRIWFLARRGELPGDPVIFAIRDRNSLIAGALVMAIVVYSWVV